MQEPVDVRAVGEQRAVLVQAVGRPVEGDLQLVALAQPRVVVERVVRARLVRVRVRARVRARGRVRGGARGRGRVRVRVRVRVKVRVGVSAWYQ